MIPIRSKQARRSVEIQQLEMFESSYWEDLLMEEGLDDLKARESFGFYKMPQIVCK